MAAVPLIAVTDDDEAVRIALSSLMRSLGYSVRTYASGEEFLGSEEKTAISCLITDVQMPGMSGIDLQAALKDQGHAFPIIFMTAFAAPHLERKAKEAGASAFLSKPFQANALIQEIEAALGR
ncbi:response regulator transcription factor [Flaviflagellibacter deserti]|uniref:Response regulator transcription factor n=1 Tax=Flaviflagellibacter deserti TaxID=2267266 RepID=A0ABV9Z3D6_9HYPH